MGSIPQYQREQFASTYVGGAQKDESGALIAGAIQDEFVEPIRKNEITKLRAREDAATDLQANNAVIQYGLDYQNGLAQLQKDYADNTAAYPEAALDFGRKLAEQQATAIADGRIRTKFEAATSSIQRQALNPAIEWVKDKNEYNANVAFDDAIRMTALTMGNTSTANAYKLNRAAFNDIDSLASGVVDDKRRAKLIKDGHKTAMEAHLFNRVMEDPEALIKAINADEYFDVPEFTADIKQDYLSKAESRIRANRTADKIARDDNLNELTRMAMAETLTFERIDADEREKKISGREANDYRKGLISRARKDAVETAKEYPQANKYLQLAKLFLDPGEPRAKFQLEVVDIWANGIVDPEEGDRWAQLKSDVLSIKGASRKAKFDANLKAVMGFAEGLYKGLSRNAATIKTAEAVKTFMSNVLSDPGPDGIGKEDVADTSIAQIQASIDPRRTAYKVGDTVPNPNGGAPGKVTGFAPNGTPMVTYREE